MSRGLRPILLLCALAAGCGAEKPLIVIGAKGDTEQRLLGHLAALMVTSRLPVRVNRQFNLDGMEEGYRALLRGDLDICPGYADSLLTGVLHRRRPEGGPERAYRIARDTLDGRGIRLLAPLGFSRAGALLMRANEARRWGVRSISDLRGREGWWRAGFTPDFAARPDGWPGLSRAYGLAFHARLRHMAPGRLYASLARGVVEVIAGTASDGRIAALRLAVLKDDRGFFPPDEACLLVRARALDRFPALEVILGRLSGRITAEAMRRLNAAVEIEGRPAEAVAGEFLRDQGLIP